MSIYLQLTIETFIVFTSVFCLNYFLSVKKNKKITKKDLPLELYCITNIYELDPKMIDFHKFQRTCALINSFIITFTYLMVIYLVKYMILKVIIGIVLLILLILICYGLLGKYYCYREEKLLSNKKNNKSSK